MHKHHAAFNTFMGSQPFTLDNWILNGNTYINTQNKLAKIAPAQKDYILSQK
jgi:hypothetical protein